MWLLRGVIALRLLHKSSFKGRMLATLGKVALVVCTLGLATQAQAQTAVTQRSQIVGAQTFTWLGHSGTNPFTAALGPVQMTVGATTLGSWYSPCKVGSCWDGGFSAGDDLLHGIGSLTYTFGFSQAITGFATQAWLNALTASPTITVTSFLGVNQTGVFDFTTGGGVNANDNSAAVVGVLDLGGFDRLEISGRSEFAMNQVSYSTSTVPEPSSIALFAVGLAGLGYAARRRSPRA